MASKGSTPVKQDAALAQQVAARPYYQLLGLRVEPCAHPGHSRLLLDSRPDLENSRGEIHGGVVASLLDAAMAVAVRSSCEAGQGAATVSLTINYVEPGRGGLVASGNVVRAGRTLASAEARALDHSGRLVAHGVATLRIVAPKT